MEFIKRHWLFFAHVGAGALIFLDPSVQHWIGAHPAYSGSAFLWAEVMRWAQSPRTK